MYIDSISYSCKICGGDYILQVHRYRYFQKTGSRQRSNHLGIWDIFFDILVFLLLPYPIYLGPHASGLISHSHPPDLHFSCIYPMDIHPALP